jgi:hypothetical protein
MSRRLVGVVAIIALATLLLGGTCQRKTLFRFRSPLLGELSLPGAVTVNLRVPNGANLGSLQLLLNGSPVALASQTVLPDGVSGTVTPPGNGVFQLHAEIDDPASGTGGILEADTTLEIVDLLNPNDCDILNNEDCLLPWPSSRFLTPTGGGGPGNALQVSIPQVAMPVLTGDPLLPDPLNELDGFSPTVQILMHFPAGVDVEASNASRLLAPGCCGQLNQTPYEDVRTHDTRSLDADSPSILIDADTGERILHWLEVDARTTNLQRQVLFMRPARSLVPGHRYIVAMRHLVDPLGNPVRPEPVFRALRAGKPSTIPAVEAKRAQTNEIFSILQANGIARHDLVLAFDFVVQSQHQLTHQILTMRDEVLNAIDANPSAFLPKIDFASHAAFNAANENDCMVPGTQIWRRLKATISVPLYLTGQVANDAVPVLNTDASGNPVQNPTTPDTFANADFLIPCSVFNGSVTVRPLLLGHGLFGTGESMVDGVAGGLLDLFADDEFPYIAAATDWRGMSGVLSEGVTENIWVGCLIVGGCILPGPHHLNDFPAFTGRLKQGMLNTLVLAHLMKIGLFNEFDEFQTTAGQPSTGVLPGSSEEQFYVGISLGGIMGTWLAALTPDIQRFNIDVPAMNFSILLQRSTQFSQFEGFLNNVGLTDPMDTAVGYGLLHEQWVSSEPASAARHVTGLVDTPLDDPSGSPLPGKKMLMTVAWVDHQVSNQASETLARTLGIPQLVGSLQQGLAEISDVAEGPSGLDSALVTYDTGSFDVFDSGLDGVTPALSNTIVSPDKCDPHGFRFPIPASLDQLLAFLQPGGTIFNFCTDDGVCNASDDNERPDGVAEASLCDPLAP